MLKYYERRITLKRNLDLIHHILITTEASNSLKTCTDDYVNDEYSFEEVSYHISLLTDDGYVIAKVVPTCGTLYASYIVERLTNKGHDFLDSIRNETVFAKTKSRIISTVGAATLDIVKDVAINITKGLLGV